MLTNIAKKHTQIWLGISVAFIVALIYISIGAGVGSGGAADTSTPHILWVAFLLFSSIFLPAILASLIFLHFFSQRNWIAHLIVILLIATSFFTWVDLIMTNWGGLF